MTDATPAEGSARPPGDRGGAVAAALDAVAIVASVAVTGLMLFLVIARYVLELSIVGLHEPILMAALALYMTGALIASRRQRHLAVDWLGARLTSPGARRAHAAAVAAVTIVVCVFFCWWSYRMLAWGIARPQLSPAWRIPVWIAQIPIAVAAVGCLAYAVRDLVAALRDRV